MSWWNNFWPLRPAPVEHVIIPQSRPRLITSKAVFKAGKWVEWGDRIGILMHVQTPECVVRHVYSDGSEGEPEMVAVDRLRLASASNIPVPRRASMSDDDLAARGYF